MKRFAKLFAAAMALVLALSAFTPAASAQAAAKPKLAVKTKTLYVGGSSVKSSLKSSYTLKVKNKPKKYSASWSVDNKDMVSIKKLSGGKCKVTANTAGKVGKATVTCTLKDKTANVVYKLQTVFTVKRNADDLKITYSGTTENMKAGDKLQITGTMIDEKGAALVSGKTVTDIIKWDSSNTDVATVENGLVTAVGNGEAVITCYTVQDASGTYSKLAKATAKKMVKVTVKEDISSVKQTALNKVAAVFGADMSKLVTKDNVTIKDKSTGLSMPVKSVEFDSTGKNVTITTLSEFPDGKTYTFKYGDIAKDFVSSNGAVVRMEVYTAMNNKAVVGEQTKLLFRLFDARGVDVTPTDPASTAYTTHASHITYRLLSTGAYDVMNGYITFALENTTAVVEGTYHSWNYNGASEVGNIITTSQITAVNEATLITPDKATIIAKPKAGKDIDFSKTNLTVAMNDSGMRMVVRAKDGSGNYIYSNDAGSKFTFMTDVNNTVFAVSDDGSIYPLQRGSASVAVRYNGKVVQSYTVTVVDARKASVLTLSVDGVTKNSETISSMPGLDELNMRLTARDQYGGEITIGSAGEVTVEAQTSFAPMAYPIANTDGSVSIKLNGGGFGSISGKTYPYKVTYGGVSTGFTVTVRDPQASATSTYKAVITGDTTLNVPGKDGSFPKIEIKLYEQKSGVNYSQINMIKPDTYSPMTDEFYYVLTGPRGKVMTGLNINYIDTVTADGNNVLTKLPSGDYTVTIYQKLSAGSRQVAVARVTLTDTQDEPKWEKVRTSTSYMITPSMSQIDMKNALLDCYSITIGGQSVGAMNIELVNPIPLNGQLIITNIKVKNNVMVNGINYCLEYTININAAIKTSY